MDKLHHDEIVNELRGIVEEVLKETYMNIIRGDSFSKPTAEWVEHSYDMCSGKPSIGKGMSLCRARCTNCKLWSYEPRILSKNMQSDPVLDLPYCPRCGARMLVCKSDA